MKKFLITIVKKIEELRTIEVQAMDRNEAEDKVLAMQSRWEESPVVLNHEEMFIDTIREQA